MARKTGLHQSSGLQAHDTALQAIPLLVVSEHVLYVDRPHHTNNQACYPRHHLPHLRSVLFGILDQHLPMHTH